MTRLKVQSFPENVSAVEKGNQSYAEDGAVTTERNADGVFKLQKKVVASVRVKISKQAERYTTTRNIHIKNNNAYNFHPLNQLNHQKTFVYQAVHPYLFSNSIAAFCTETLKS